MENTRLSNHFTLAEFINANKYPDNKPTMQDVVNMTYGCHMLLEPACEVVGPILINSGYRCEWINKKVGGVKNSQHTKGEAADIRTWDYNGVNNSVNNRRLLGLILYSGLSFDQCIAENCDENGYPEWIHISFKTKSTNRGQFLVKKRPTPAPSPKG